MKFLERDRVERELREKEREREGGRSEGRRREKRGKGKERRRILVNTVHSVPYLVSTVSAKDYSIIQIL